MNVDKVFKHTWSRPYMPNVRNETYPTGFIRRFCTACGLREARERRVGGTIPQTFLCVGGNWLRKGFMPECTAYDPLSQGVENS